MKDPRDELAALSAELRGRVRRERDRGRSHLLSPRLSSVLRASSPGGRAAAPAGGPAPSAASKPAAPKAAAPSAASKPAASKAAAPTAASKPAASKPAAPKATALKPAAPRPAAPKAPATGGRGNKLPLIDVEPASPAYESNMAELARLGETAAVCEKCGLCQTRTNVVFSRGRARNRVMFVGEAPGGNEDEQGVPFVGRAGKLLDQIIDAAGFRREEIYITNILKCRPPQNRDPKPEEIAACTPYLERQIDLIEPRIICALGRFAAQFLTGKAGAPMGQLRGKIDTYRDRIRVLPTYHPAALLRNPNLKRVVWEDVQLLRREYLR